MPNTMNDRIRRILTQIEQRRDASKMLCDSFHVTGLYEGEAPGSVSRLSFEGIMFNEGDPGTVVTDRQVEICQPRAIRFI